MNIEAKYLVEALTAQRNAALDEAAQWRAIAQQRLAELIEAGGDDGLHAPAPTDS